MKFRFAAFGASLTLIFCPGEVFARQDQPPSVTVGIVTDGSYPRHANLTQMVRDEIVRLVSIDVETRVPADKIAEGDWTVSGINAAIDRLLGDSEVDLVVTLGPIASHLVAQRRDLAKPVVAALIIDADAQGLPRAGPGTGVPNLHYLVAVHSERIMPAFREIASFNRVALLFNEAFLDAMPALSARVRSATADLSIDPVVVPVGADVDAALSGIASDIEAVFVAPLMQFTDQQFARLATGLIQRQLPSFSWFGPAEVRAGILATLTPDTFTQQLARRIALSVQHIVGGEDAATMPVAFAAQERLAINVATARAIGAYPTWKLLTEANLIADDTRGRGRQLSLDQAVREAVQANLELAVRDRAVAVGAEDVNLAKSILMPQIDVSADWRVIDPDRAEASLGLLPEREFSASANFSQLLFAEPTWANYSAQRSVQESRVHDREALRLDIALDAAVAYLSVLRVKTLEQIERDNLALSRANLETAELRVSVGTATLSEVYRWETQIAGNRQAVIDATAQQKLTEIDLNRLLNRPLEEAFETVEPDLDDPVLLSSQERLYPYIDNPWSFEVFRQFMALEALEASPELGALRSLVDASGRVLQSTERSFWVPIFSLNAGVRNRFATGGAGSDPGVTIPGLTPPNDLSWTLGFRLSYPLFAGSSRFAERAQASAELARLEFERDAVAERVEQRVRASLYHMGASYAGIELSTDASDAAHNNYDLVFTAYRTGLGSILDLLDAQNAALIADGVAANAVYDFLIDLMRMQRAVGRTGTFRSADESAAFYQRLEAFFEEVGGPVRR